MSITKVRFWLFVPLISEFIYLSSYVLFFYSIFGSSTFKVTSTYFALFLIFIKILLVIIFFINSKTKLHLIVAASSIGIVHLVGTFLLALHSQRENRIRDEPIINIFRYYLGDPFVRFEDQPAIQTLKAVFGLGNAPLNIRLFEFAQTLNFMLIFFISAFILVLSLMKEGNCTPVQNLENLSNTNSIPSDPPSATEYGKIVSAPSSIHAKQLADLERLGILYKDGLLTHEEFQQKKRQILDF